MAEMSRSPAWGLVLVPVAARVAGQAPGQGQGFARAVKREDMTLGAELLGLSVEEHIGNCLVAMQAHAEELGL